MTPWIAICGIYMTPWIAISQPEVGAQLQTFSHSRCGALLTACCLDLRFCLGLARQRDDLLAPGVAQFISCLSDRALFRSRCSCLEVGHKIYAGRFFVAACSTGL